MTTTPLTLSERLRPFLYEVTVAEDGLSAALGGHRIERDSAKECLGALADALYEQLHAGLPPDGGPRPKGLRHPCTEAALAAVVPHERTPRTVEVVADETDRLIVRLDGVRVAVARDSDAVEEVSEGRATLRLPAARPALSQGFFLVDGSRGRPVSGPLLRFYAHVTEVAHMADVWRIALEFLEDLGVPYQAKALSNPSLYPRRDALVVYLGAEAWQAVSGLVMVLDPLPGLGAATSPFTRELSPGLSIAWEPADPRPGNAGLSFGQHRAKALTEGLFAARAQPDAVRLACLADALLAAGVDPAEPYRNTDSPLLTLTAPEGQ